MAQVTDSLLAEFQARVEAGQHINSTIHEEAQLLHGFREWKKVTAYAEKLEAAGIELLTAADAIVTATVCAANGDFSQASITRSGIADKLLDAARSRMRTALSKNTIDQGTTQRERGEPSGDGALPAIAPANSVAASTLFFCGNRVAITDGRPLDALEWWEFVGHGWIRVLDLNAEQMALVERHMESEEQPSEAQRARMAASVAKMESLLEDPPRFDRTLEELAAWLDKKYGRHGEWCDKLAADAIRAYAALQAKCVNGVGSDFDAWLKTSDGRWAYKLCVEKCTPKEAMNLLRRTFAAGAGNVADAQRLDFLEGEMERELTHPRTVTPTRSLFRRNVPVTRAEIDKAMQAWSEVEHRCTWCGTRHAGYYITDCPIPGKSLPSQVNSEAVGKAIAAERDEIAQVGFPIFPTSASPDGYGKCEVCGKPVYPPTNRYMAGAYVFNNKAWHGDCFPRSGISGTTQCL